MKTRVQYHIITDLLGGRANGRSPEIFYTHQEAVVFWEKEYKNRNKGDGYDEYWRKTPLRIQKTIEEDMWDE